MKSVLLILTTARLLSPAVPAQPSVLDNPLVAHGFFATQLQNLWMNSPTVRHSRGAIFAFADGHAARWQWRGLRTEQDWWAPALSGGVDSSADLRRMQDAVAER